MHNFLKGTHTLSNTQTGAAAISLTEFIPFLARPGPQGAAQYRFIQNIILHKKRRFPIPENRPCYCNSCCLHRQDQLIAFLVPGYHQVPQEGKTDDEPQGRAITHNIGQIHIFAQVAVLFQLETGKERGDQ